MKIVTWNVAGARGLGPKKTAALVGALEPVSADVLLLQEVAAGETAVQLGATLATIGLPHFHHASTPESPRKQYGCAIASRWPLTPSPPDWAPNAPFPQLLARATVHRPAQAVDVVSAHAPNGSRNGWRKIETIEALLEGVAERQHPLVVGGDFNEPVQWAPGARPESAARRETANGVSYTGDWKRADKGAGTEESHPRARWQGAVEALLLGTSSGLRHAFRTLHPSEVPTTHVTSRGTERFFDHLLVSPELEILEAGYNDDWRTVGASDHSGGWVVLG
jgi:endonuclease/exonuclease/phosphatase family metal-dependent hydrolase